VWRHGVGDNVQWGYGFVCQMIDRVLRLVCLGWLVVVVVVVVVGQGG
jgi:hypothetical protein